MCHAQSVWFHGVMLTVIKAANVVVHEIGNALLRHGEQGSLRFLLQLLMVDRLQLKIAIATRVGCNGRAYSSVVCRLELLLKTCS